MSEVFFVSLASNLIQLLFPDPNPMWHLWDVVEEVHPETHRIQS